MDILEQIRESLETLPQPQQNMALDILDDYVLYAARVKELKKLPYIRVDKRNPEKQEITPAGRLIKDYTRTLNGLRQLLSSIVFRCANLALREENLKDDEPSELMKLLAQFEDDE